MKKNKTLIIILIVILSILALLLTSTLIYLLDERNDYDNKNNQSNLLYDEKYNIEEIEKIFIKTTSSDIIIEESLDENVEVMIYANEEKNVDVDFLNNELNIAKNDSKDFCIGICNDKDEIVIKLPSEYKKNIEIETKSGDVSSRNFDYASMNVSVVSGDIEIHNIKDVIVNTTSGDVEIYNISNSCDISTTSGDIEINNIFLSNNSKIETVSGDIEIDRIDNVYIEGETTSGRKNINNSNRMSNVSLKLKTVSGDIEVNND